MSKSTDAHLRGRVTPIYLQKLYPLFSTFPSYWLQYCFLLISVFYQFIQPPLLFAANALQEQDTPVVTYEIHYRLSGAGEVFLVWGINGWQPVPEASRPAGTIIKDDLQKTPMKLKDGEFVVTLQLPTNTRLDYGFHITKDRNSSEIKALWDGNYQDNITRENVITVESKPAISKKISTGMQQVARERRDFWLWIIGIGFVIGVNALASLSYLRSNRRISSYLIGLQLGSILAVALLLRLNHLNQPYIDAFSWREASTAMVAENYYRRNWNIFYPEAHWGGPGPGYQGREFQTVSYLAALLYTIFGQQDWIGRTVASVFGVWGVFALYQLVRRVWDKERAMASAAVMAILPGSVFIERSFLPDPAMVALVTTSLWLLAIYLQTNQRRYLIFAGLIGTWGVLTKIPGLIVGLPILYTILTILRSRQALRLNKLITLGAVGLLTLIPVIVYYLWARHLSYSYPPYVFVGQGNWLWNDGLQNWWQQSYFLPGLQHTASSWLWTTPALSLMLVSFFFHPLRAQYDEAISSRLSTDNSGKAAWIFHWWLVAGAIYYIIGAEELIKNPWNYHIVTPAVAALAGHGIVSIAMLIRRVFKQPALGAVTALVLLAIGIYGQAHLKWLYEAYAKEGYRLGLALHQVSQPDDLVVIIGNDLGDPTGNYYSRRRGWIFPPWSHLSGNDLPKDDPKLIMIFEQLRTEGADWLGIVNERRKDIWTNHPTFIEHVEQTSEIYRQTSDYTIYRILSPEELAKLH